MGIGLLSGSPKLRCLQVLYLPSSPDSHFLVRWPVALPFLGQHIPLLTERFFRHLFLSRSSSIQENKFTTPFVHHHVFLRSARFDGEKSTGSSPTPNLRVEGRGNRPLTISKELRRLREEKPAKIHLLREGSVE